MSEQNLGTTYSPISIYVANPKLRDQIGSLDTQLRLPVTAEDFDAALKLIRVDESENVFRFQSLSIGRNALKRHLPRSLEMEQFNELNYLAGKISDMTKDDRNVFFAALEAAKEPCDSIAEVINLAENLSIFELRPVFSLEMHGEVLIDIEGDVTAEVFKRLEKSENPDERRFIEYVERLERVVNHAEYAKETAELEGGMFTEYGYLLPSDELKQIYRGSYDIPLKYCCFDEGKQGALNADMTDATPKMTDCETESQARKVSVAQIRRNPKNKDGRGQ